VTGYGISQEDVDEQFALAKEVFDLPFEERAKYAADFDNGGYNGYTGPDLEHFKKQANRAIRNTEVFNLPKFTQDFADQHAIYTPAPIKAKIEKVEKFSKAVHENVVRPLLIIFAIVLQLADENYFADRHDYQKKSEDHLRWMKYNARSEAENEEARGLYGGGHTDLGSVTLLFRQPVAALQVLSQADNTWHWVKPHKESITVNVADTLQILSGYYLKSSVHRVHVPPRDQAHLDRLGVLYFVRPNNDVLVEVVPKSPVLEAEGVYAKLAAEKDRPAPVTVETWVKAKQAWNFSQRAAERYSGAMKVVDEGVSTHKKVEDIVAGIPVLSYS